MAVPKTIAEIFAAEAPAGSGTVLNLEGLSPSERQKAINRKAEEFEKLCQAGDVFTAKEKIRSMIESVSVTKDGSVLISGNDKRILAEKNLLDLRKLANELEEDIAQAHPFSELESKIVLSKDVYEDFCSNPLMNAMLNNLSQAVELKVVGEDEEVPADAVGLGKGLRKAHPPGKPEMTFNMPQDVYEEFCKNPLAKVVLEEILKGAELRIVEEEKDAQTKDGLGDINESGVPKGI